MIKEEEERLEAVKRSREAYENEIRTRSEREKKEIELEHEELLKKEIQRGEAALLLKQEELMKQQQEIQKVKHLLSVLTSSEFCANSHLPQISHVEKNR
jgi:hypothetical protein